MTAHIDPNMLRANALRTSGDLTQGEWMRLNEEINMRITERLNRQRMFDEAAGRFLGSDVPEVQRWNSEEDLLRRLEEQRRREAELFEQLNLKRSLPEPIRLPEPPVRQPEPPEPIKQPEPTTRPEPKPVPTPPELWSFITRRWGVKPEPPVILPEPPARQIPTLPGTVHIKPPEMPIRRIPAPPESLPIKPPEPPVRRPTPEAPVRLPEPPARQPELPVPVPPILPPRSDDVKTPTPPQPPARGEPAPQPPPNAERKILPPERKPEPIPPPPEWDIGIRSPQPPEGKPQPQPLPQPQPPRETTAPSKANPPLVSVQTAERRRRALPRASRLQARPSQRLNAFRSRIRPIVPRRDRRVQA